MVSRREGVRARAARAVAIVGELARLYPAARCALNYTSAFELLVATVLSAQTTDARVNSVTPELFANYPDAEALAAANTADLERIVFPLGFYRSKAKALWGLGNALMERHGGEVPAELEALVKLPGVGRKTANVVLGNAFAIPGITVDTHVGRLSRRLGLSSNTDPVKVEFDLQKLWAPESWTVTCHRLIEHGRRVCHSRKPECGSCELAEWCRRVGVD